MPISQSVFPFSFRRLWGRSHCCTFQLEKLILMSQSGYRVVRSNEDFGVLGDLGDLGRAKITQVDVTWN